MQSGLALLLPPDRGCLYLISNGTERRPSLLADASESGDSLFFYTFGRLVGQDKDELRDVYDARVGGGIASQSPESPPVCESVESCHGHAQGASAEATPASATFQGPQNPKPKRGKSKHKRHRGHHRKHAHKKKGKGKRHRAEAHLGRRAGKGGAPKRSSSPPPRFAFAPWRAARPPRTPKPRWRPGGSF